MNSVPLVGPQKVSFVTNKQMNRQTDQTISSLKGHKKVFKMGIKLPQRNAFYFE